MIYLDYQATTPVAPEVAAAMAPWAEEKFANPHSPSRWGREADAAIEHARGQVEAGVERPGRALFTGSATEAINWALKGSVECASPGRDRIVTIATEHAAVLDTCEWLEQRGVEVVRLPVGTGGLVALNDVGRAVNERTLMVAAMLVNNEIGVIQPIAEIAAIAHANGALMLCDAVQGYGRLPIPEGPDFVAISAHKIHGPKASGALWVRDGVTPPAPLIHGGGQEGGLRSGTLSPALCVGFGAAAKLASERRTADAAHVDELWEAARSTLGQGWTVNGSGEQRYRGNLNIQRIGLDAARLLSDLRGIAFSLGSACASGSGRPSHVLRALGLDDRDARSSIRLGFGRYTTKDDLIEAVTAIDTAAKAQIGVAQ